MLEECVFNDVVIGHSPPVLSLVLPLVCSCFSSAVGIGGICRSGLGYLFGSLKCK